MEPYDFQAGATLLVNKPLDWTSFDVVNKIRWALRNKLQVKKIKVGHAGTLDPKATGLLLICTGKSTKQLADYQGLGKVYTGTLKVGATTPSFDTETEEDTQFPIDHIDKLLLDKTREELVGPLEQYPPMYSAVKVAGQPLYKLARRGKQIEVQPRPVQVYEFEFTRVDLPLVSFRVACSKGTYIRSLAYDFGRLLGSGAYLTALCRTQIGKHQLEDAWNLDDLIRHIQEE